MFDVSWLGALITVGLLTGIGWTIRRAIAKRPNSHVGRSDHQDDDWSSRVIENQGKQRQHPDSTDHSG